MMNFSRSQKNTAFLIIICGIAHWSISQSHSEMGEPTITYTHISTFHSHDGYSLNVNVQVEHSEGIENIVLVKIIDVEDTEIELEDHLNGQYGISFGYGQSPPTLGEILIIAIDIDEKSDTVLHTLTNIIEEIPMINYPRTNELVSTSMPTFDWSSVIDDQGPITYLVNIYRQENGDHLIWNVSGLTSSQVDYDFDNSASEVLEEGKTYLLELTASGPEGNESYTTSTFTVGSYVVINNGFIKVRFHPYLPYVKDYELLNNNRKIEGEISDVTLVATIDLSHDMFYVKPLVDSVSIDSDSITYHLSCDLESTRAIEFDLSYTLRTKSVTVDFKNVIEFGDFKLIFVRSPELATLLAMKPNAKLVFPEYEGRLIDITESDVGNALIAEGTWDRPLLASMLYYDSLNCIVSFDHLDSYLSATISDHPILGRVGSIGMVFNYRYKPADFINADYVEVFDSITTMLSVDLDFISDLDGDGDVDWIDGAKVLRDKVAATPSAIYANSFINKMNHIGSPIWTSFEAIKQLSNLTDHSKIISYLLFTNFIQSDHKYGLEQDLDPSFSTLEDLITVFDSSATFYNSYLGFHDNYTDYSPLAPDYDSTLRSIGENGLPRPGADSIDSRIPYSFTLDYSDYVETKGIDRIQNTLTRYPIRESHHIDVFNLVIPIDFSKSHPNSREQGRRALLSIIHEFEKGGINISTEGITGPFVESGIGSFLDVPRIFVQNTAFSEMKIIPLVEFIYHGKTLYGLYEDIYFNTSIPEGEIQKYAFLEPLLLGANAWSHIGPNDLELDKFYLIDLPWMMLNTRFMTDYLSSDSVSRVVYSEDTYVEVDYGSDSYTVMVDGEVIGEDYATIFPKSDSVILVYSRDAKTVEFDLPSSWSSNVLLMELTKVGVVPGPVYNVSNGKISFLVKSNTPYKLYYTPDCDNPGQNIWVGPSIGNWNDNSANWSRGFIPKYCDNVVIPNGYSVTLLSTLSAECNTLEVQPHANFFVESGSSLNVIAQKND